MGHAVTATNGVSLSLIVPTYNESRRVEGPLREMGGYLDRQTYSSEIVVVDDGSDDDTCDIVVRVAQQLKTPVRLYRYERNRGKGYALKVGFAKARGERLLFTDVDLSTPIEEAQRLLDALESGNDIAIGSRKLAGSQIAVHQPLVREQMGKVFTALVRFLIAEVSDATCGFKAFRGDVGREVFSRVRVYDWSFDAEILRMAQLRGHTIEEVPVRWEDRAGSKVHLLRDVIGSLVGILRIRVNSALGRYDVPVAIGPVREVLSSEGADPDRRAS